MAKKFVGFIDARFEERTGKYVDLLQRLSKYIGQVTIFVEGVPRELMNDIDKMPGVGLAGYDSSDAVRHIMKKMGLPVEKKKRKRTIKKSPGKGTVSRSEIKKAVRSVRRKRNGTAK